MHRPLTNVLITKENKVKLIDFERMHKSKKPHNVTQFCQFLINRANFLRKKGFTFTKNQIINFAVKYKKDKSYFKDLKLLIQ